MHSFDYRFLKRDRVSSGILERAVNIEGMRSRCECSPCPQSIKEALERRAIIMSVADSNAIENIRTSEERLIGIVSNRVAPIGHDEEEIAGYCDALRHIHDNHGTMVLSRDTILELYGILMKYSDRDPRGFKDRDNVIVDRAADGRIVKVHHTVPAAETDHCIEELIAAYWEVRNDFGINKLLLIACFIQDFLCIHPFLDGNGRMSRLLTVLLLYQEGYDICRYISMESMINASRQDYYHALEETEEGWFEGTNDYTPFMSYFLSQIFLCYREYGIRMGEEMGRSSKSDSLRLFLRNSPMPISKTDLSLMFPQLSVTTIERVLKDMCDSGEIVMTGNHRSARYVAADR